jgi:hypothetical protein
MFEVGLLSLLLALMGLMWGLIELCQHLSGGTR